HPPPIGFFATVVDLPVPSPRRKPAPGLLGFGAFVVAALLAALVAWGLAIVVENRSGTAVTSRLLAEGYTWANVETNGLIVALSGTAPNEAMRFSAMNLAGTIVDSGRLRDGFEVTPAKVVGAPRFSVEMLRNDDEVQLIGLLPDGDSEAKLTVAAKALTSDTPPMDMLETAAYPAPDNWEAALTFGVQALELLPRSKISVSAAGVTVTAIAASLEEKRSFEDQLTKSTPAGLSVTTDISAPRPVLTPYTLRFVIDQTGPHFDACAADTVKARTRILAAAHKAGAMGDVTCTIGLGVPSPSWGQATSAAIATMAQLGSGTVTFSDADVTLLAGDDVTQASFDREIGELRASLPEVFSLDAKMPEKAKTTAAGPVEFTATRAANTHLVEMRGRLTDDRVQAAVASFAKARFGGANVRVATRLDPDLPDGWPERVLAGLQALAQLDHGALLVRPDTVEISGVSGQQNASATISQLLSGRLGQGKTFKVNVTYDKQYDPLAALPTAQQCADNVHAVLAAKKISFDPGSAEIDAGSAGVLNALAIALKNCIGVKMEIAGHTDAQGSDGGNLSLSQARAEAVLVALQGRQVDVSGMYAKGYGEGVPIADNGNETGREANRRIEFSLVGAATPTVSADATIPADTPTVSADATAPADTPTVTDPATQPADAMAAPTIAAPDSSAPDFSGDDSPSLALHDKTARPKPRPAQN
ncbi:MAG: OmpA family protein, partial [Paracoccaceae bacterium]